MDDRYIDILGMFYCTTCEKGEKCFNVSTVCFNSVVGKALFCDQIPIESLMQGMKKIRELYFVGIVCQGSGIVDEQAMIRLLT